MLVLLAAYIDFRPKDIYVPVQASQVLPVTKNDQFYPVTFTSDPTGANVYIDGQLKGKTPLTVDIKTNTDTTYLIIADEPFEDYNLYKDYRGVLNPIKPDDISVWLERTTEIEQLAQRDDKARAERAYKCIEVLESQLILESWNLRREFDYAIGEGRVTNISSETLENVEAIAEFFTNQSEFVSYNSALIEYTALLPNQTSPFSVYEDYNPAMSFSVLNFKHLLGGSISMANRQDYESCKAEFGN